MYIPLQLNFNEKETVGPCVVIHFQECKTPINLPVEKVSKISIIFVLTKIYGTKKIL